MNLHVQSKTIRTVLRWQVLATAVAAMLAGWLAGMHGAISATLGGSIIIVAGLIFAVMASRSGKAKSAGEALYGALRVEAIKLVVMVFLLWLVFATYREVVAVGLIGTFAASVLIFAMAVFVRET